MREILFRGKRTDVDELNWTYGHYYKIPNAMPDSSDRHVIVSINNGMGATLFHNPVEKETIGQYIGLKDKNDKKIFEGDIIETEDYIGWIYFDYMDTTFALKYYDSQREIYALSLSGIDIKKSEVIGNIYDNPELKGE